MYTAQELIETEAVIKALWEDGKLPSLIHLCGGNEEQLIGIFNRVKPGDWVLSTHRAHYHFLLAGATKEELVNAVLTGRSMFLFSKKLNFLCSSIVAGNACIAAGIAQSLKDEGSANKVWCFVGDGAEDEGHFYEAVRMVDGHDLPCTFIVEDNDRSVDSPKSVRYKKPFSWPSCVERYEYTPTYPHAGSGCKHHIVFTDKVPLFCQSA